MINGEIARPDSEKVGHKEAIGAGGEGCEEEMGADDPVMEELLTRQGLWMKRGGNLYSGEASNRK